MRVPLPSSTKRSHVVARSAVRPHHTGRASSPAEFGALYDSTASRRSRRSRSEMGGAPPPHGCCDNEGEDDGCNCRLNRRGNCYLCSHAKGTYGWLPEEAPARLKQIIRRWVRCRLGPVTRSLGVLTREVDGRYIGVLKSPGTDLTRGCVRLACDRGTYTEADEEVDLPAVVLVSAWIIDPTHLVA